MNNDLMERIVSLCKRRGLIYPGSEIYGGLANSWDYGPLGVELKNNIKKLWWKRFVQTRGDIVGMDASIILNPKVWEASGHVANFTDPLVECKLCHERLRADQEDLIKEHEQTHHGRKLEWTKPCQFNMMFKTYVGAAETSANTVHLRPETAQAIFINFKNVVDSTRIKVPFGIAQIGKAFRNEITPGNFIFRTREFEQMEIEYFIPPPHSDKNWQKIFDHFRAEMLLWMKDDLVLDMTKVYEHEIPDDERSHYSKRTIDFEYDFPFGRKELYGLAYRTDYDLKSHENMSGRNMKYRDPETGEEYWPHVIEPSLGVERSVLAVLLAGYSQESDRVILKLNPKLAPIKVAIFPLLANKPELETEAKKIHDDLMVDFAVAWDDRGNIGKRYLAQDEIGTPFCITVDFQSLEDKAVTIRDRDTTKQVRIKTAEAGKYLQDKING